jgi:hypothetical protein
MEEEGLQGKGFHRYDLLALEEAKLKKVKVELVGLFPTLVSACVCCEEYMEACNINLLAEQLKDYPPDVLDAQNRAIEIYARLMRDYGDRIDLVAVGWMSLRGLWLSLRHRLGNEFSIVINGRKVIRGDSNYEAIREAIEEELREIREG